jgi:3-deoxy-D-manno-octulosonic acid kinase
MHTLVANGVTHFYLHAPDADIPPGLFESDWLRAEGRLVSDNALGRGTAWLFAHAGGEYVLRHYHRGGAMAKLSRDQYLWAGLQASRAAREYHLLLRLAEWGLPVPRPLAAHVARRGAFYRCDLITARIADARTLAERLAEAELPAGIWQRVGQTIRRFHDAGVYHADLNANNILLDAADKPWLIDFDKGAFKAGEKWKQANLDRLRRSLDKLIAADFERGWQALLAGCAVTLTAERG